MRTLFIAFIVFSLLTAQAFGQAERIRQRARAVANQTNAQQNVDAPSSQASPTNKPPAAAPATPAAPLKPTTQQQANAKLKVDLAAVRAKGQATPDLKQRFTRDLMAAARGTAKPSAYSVDKFADMLLAAAASKNLSSTNDARLVQDMIIAANSFGLSATRMQEIINDLQSALKTAGLADDSAAAIANEFKTLALEVQTADVK
jgi:chorismate mutase